MKFCNRKVSPDLVLIRDKRNADIQGAFLNVKKQITNLSLLDEKNRKRFGEGGRQSRLPQMPFLVENDMLCGVAHAAALDGRPAVIAAVREATRSYFDKRCADVLSELPPETDADIVTAYLAETSAQSVTEPLQASAALFKDVVSIERAAESSRSYRRKLDQFLGACDRKVRELRDRRTPRPTHLRALS